MLRNEITRSEDWTVMVDLFMHRTITEVKKTTADDGEDEADAEEEFGDNVLNKNTTAGGEAGEGDEEEEEEEGEAKDDE